MHQVTVECSCVQYKEEKKMQAIEIGYGASKIARLDNKDTLWDSTN